MKLYATHFIDRRWFKWTRGRTRLSRVALLTIKLRLRQVYGGGIL